MADIEIQPVSDAYSSVSDRKHLIEQLDELLVKYLHTLDAYQKAQQELAKYLSAGHMSLAQANFANNAHTRYGQDYYDERMQASRKIIITEDGDKTVFSIKHPASEAPTRASEAQITPSENEATETEDPDASTKQNLDPPEKSEEDIDVSNPEKKTRPTDPIRWFGVLVPPALRSAQSSFISAVSGPIPTLSSLIKDLRHQEIEIGRIRKQLKKL